MNVVAGFQPERLKLVRRDRANRLHRLVGSHHSLDDVLGLGRVAFGNNEFGEHRLTATELERSDPHETAALGYRCRIGHRSKYGLRPSQEASMLQNRLCSAAAL